MPLISLPDIPSNSTVIRHRAITYCEQIFIIGDLILRQESSSITAIDPMAKSMMNAGNLNTRQYAPVVAVTDDNIYVVGGVGGSREWQYHALPLYTICNCGNHCILL